MTVLFKRESKSLQLIIFTIICDTKIIIIKIPMHFLAMANRGAPGLCIIPNLFPRQEPYKGFSIQLSCRSRNLPLYGRSSYWWKALFLEKWSLSRHELCQTVLHQFVLWLSAFTKIQSDVKR